MQKIVIAQGGGPTAVINRSLAGLTLAARKSGVKSILGARHGVGGILRDDYINLNKATAETINLLRNTPGSALGSSREKPDKATCGLLLERLQRTNIDGFFYIGGNDTSATLSILAKAAAERGSKTLFVHVPKTVDNDLVENDHTPGYPSAALYVARVFLGLNYDQKSLPGVHIGVVMGRHAGFLTAAANGFRTKAADGPHITLIPEIAVRPERVVEKTAETVAKHGRCLLAVSEGITDENGKLFAAAEARDPHGNVQLSGSGGLADKLAEAIKLGLQKRGSQPRVRGDTLGYAQRSFFGCVAAADAKEAEEIGAFAFTRALSRGESFSATINRKGGRSEFGAAPLERIGGKTRYLPPEFYDRELLQTTPAFNRWLAPLLGESPRVADLF